MPRRKLTVWKEQEAIKLARGVPDKLLEIVKTYKSKARARSAVCPPAEFLIEHDNGQVSVAVFTEKPECTQTLPASSPPYA